MLDNDRSDKEFPNNSVRTVNLFFGPLITNVGSVPLMKRFADLKKVILKFEMLDECICIYLLPFGGRNSIFLFESFSETSREEHASFFSKI